MSRPYNTENLYRAVAHRVRRTALEMLAKRAMKAGELAAALGGSRPGVSQHLQVLRQTGLIVPRRIGTSIVYRLNRNRIQQLCDWPSRLSRQG